MNNVEKEFFKYEKQMELMQKLKPFIIELKSKYKNSINLYVEFDSILICLHDLSFKKDMPTIIDDLIKLINEQYNESYYLLHNKPIEMWSLPNKLDLSLSWMLERKLKEDELV